MLALKVLTRLSLIIAKSLGNQPTNIKSNSLTDQSQEDAWERMSHLGAAGVPFLFLADFKGGRVEVITLDKLEDRGILVDIQGFTNSSFKLPMPHEWYFEKYPIRYAQYLKGFELVKKHIQSGDSYLVNYTCATPISTNLTLRQIFHLGKARYKVFYKNKFTFFSPETFVKIENGRISTYPMKGTIDASLPNARQQILNDKKETAEHNTIVDLLRNDLSQVARRVQVERFRYVEKIRTNGKDLLQVSSEITGQLPEGWQGRLGDVFKKLLPAGSISGAPKKKTVEIIEAAEEQFRGFYTGIVGLFDGNRVDSGVAIRFIEKADHGMQFRSGGGITNFSDPVLEYQEMMDKVYLTRSPSAVNTQSANSTEPQLACS